MLSIQTNVDSLIAQQNLNVTNQFMSQTIQQLTSGYRINSSGDDAAGLAVANQLTNNIAQVTQGVANGNDGVAQLQIMDGGMSNISQILDRLQTLATQSASASFTGDRTTLNNEFQTDIQEINRQAQAIGLNTGGTFATNLAVYLGGGAGASSASTLSNGTVNVNLSNSTVDAQALGLSGVQATNGTAYDLNSTSLATILGAANSNPTSTQFTFNGPGFGSGVSVLVNLNGVQSVSGLVNNINSAIQTAAGGTSAADTAFANANITASIVTDSNGDQQLAFNSTNAAFAVTSGDTTASALMGSFNGGQAGGVGSATATLVANGSSQLSGAGLNWGTDMAGTENQVITISANDANGNAHALSVTLGTGAQTMGQAITAINTALQASGDSTLQQITAVQTAADTNPGGSLNFISTLPGFTISVGGSAVTGDGVTSDIGSSVASTLVGTGGTANISTLAGATSAVSAVSSAVQALGTAQAAIGKGENQLNYAINLASSQITNFSAAESQIRDADIAQEAANLSKSQVLQQASIAAMAQANSAPQAVLALLKT